MQYAKNSTSPEFSASLEQLYPNLSELITQVRLVWPEHEFYMDKSLKIRTPSLLSTSDSIAAAILTLSANSIEDHARDYRWLCEMIMEEEMFFARNGHYRYSTFEETNKFVYSDRDFMKKYMNGLLFSQVLWYMHASSLHFFTQRLSSRLTRGGAVLEIGSGHGLMLYLSLRDLGMSEAVAWDISEVSLEQTREALRTLGALDRSRFAIQDMHKAGASGEKFDLVILSHILEHLENPVDALANIRDIVSKNGLLFVNVPLNAPMPDHLVLLEHPRDAEKLLTDGGFQIVESSTHTTQGTLLSKALRSKTAVTCSIIAQLA